MSVCVCFPVWKGRVEVFQSHFWRLRDVPVYRGELLGYQVCQRWAASHWWVSSVLKFRGLISWTWGQQGLSINLFNNTFFQPVLRHSSSTQWGSSFLELKTAACWSSVNHELLLGRASLGRRAKSSSSTTHGQSDLQQQLLVHCQAAYYLKLCQFFRISILFDGSLEILNATTNDEGVYTCFAENDRGKANSSGYLTITGQWICAYTERQVG